MRAPWCRSGWTYQKGSLNGGEGGTRTYIIPRFNGEVVIGGTREVDDWNPIPRMETTLDILKRALRIFPALAPPAIRLSGREPRPEDLLPFVDGELVGFRPSRKCASNGADSGLRLEKGQPLISDGAETEVIYNYGHGGFGWQSCWGCAEDVIELLGGPRAKEVSPAYRRASGLSY